MVNDALRSAIVHCIRVAGLLLSRVEQFRIRAFTANQQRLTRIYESRSDEIPNPSPGGKFAFTSGSAGEPKRILYPSRRLRALKFVFTDMFARACWAFRIKRTSLYVFSSFAPDESLTSLLLDEIDLPNYFATLQAPYRVQRHPAIRALAEEYGPTAVRLWLLTISNPGVLYSTNPSSISTFFAELENHWRENSRLVANWSKDPKRFNPDIRKIARRLDSAGSAQRLRAIATSDEPLPIGVWAPALEAYICWTGGYVKPFLDQVQKYLPATRYRLIPMYSMSTETIETISHFQNKEVYFLPLATDVLYEFIEDETDRLLGPTELQPGKLYEMVVSDAYGLRRYRTGDLFLCRRKLGELPDLAFVRRRGLAYSFTGEKLTADQVSIVFDELRTQYPNVFVDRYVTCVPAQPSDALPHYKVLLIGDQRERPDLDLLATRCDELLAEVNCEYRSKRASGRLGAIRIIETRTREFAERFAPNGTWESQFKFLPLCPYLIWNDSKRVS
jgi:hypothetical protein